MSKRVRFFLGHLITSMLLISSIVCFVLFVWYPAPLAQAVGAMKIILILAMIDIIIGPVLGFLVYKEGKKSLKFDLTVIIAVQLIALSYGVYSVAQGRPTWIVYNVDRFELVKYNETIQPKADIQLTELQHVSWLQPKFVAVKFSEDKAQREQDMLTELTEGVSIAQRPERYISLNEAEQHIKQRAINLDLLKKFNEPSKVESILKKYPQATAYLPLKSMQDMTVLINHDSAEVVKIVDLRPW